jgi:hypothetical protein
MRKGFSGSSGKRKRPQPRNEFASGYGEVQREADGIRYVSAVDLAKGNPAGVDAASSTLSSIYFLAYSNSGGRLVVVYGSA